MSRPIYMMDGPEKMSNGSFNYQDAYDRLIKEIDNTCFKKIDEAAQVEHINAVAEINKAIEALNRPDYFLLSNTKHREELEEFIKTLETVKIKILYSPLVDETTFYLLKNDGTQEGSFGYSTILYDTNPLQFPTYEFHITHPEFITKVIID